ncbi:MAG: alpha/beta hydrolase [Alteromonadaceae bacterium]|nr:alpha/beta hydrolase [Alteromonadaceae bacterium]
MIIRKLCTALLFSAVATVTNAGEVYSQLPSEIKASDAYVFYSHGYIVEGDNPTPRDSRFGWGKYDFPAIKKSLADSPFHVIATHRSKNTNPFDYSKSLAKQVRTLLEAGVKPSNITIMGFSRGAFITGLTSNLLKDTPVNTIILAGCGRLVTRQHDDISVYGDVLSVYEASDRASTCARLKDKSPDVKSYQEISINTGLSHGAFYRPIPEWIEPVKQWIVDKMQK